MLNTTHIAATVRAGPEKKYSQDRYTLYSFQKKYLPGAVARLLVGNFILSHYTGTSCVGSGCNGNEKDHGELTDWNSWGGNSVISLRAGV